MSSFGAFLIGVIAYAVVVDAMLLLDLRRGRLAPEEKPGVFGYVRPFLQGIAALLAYFVTTSLLEKWLSARFGFSDQVIFWICAAIAATIQTVFEAVLMTLRRRREWAW